MEQTASPNSTSQQSSHASLPDGDTSDTKQNAGPPTTVSAVVINYNGGQRIINTIEALVNQPYPLTQILLIDNDSTDGTPEKIRAQFADASIPVHVHDMGCNEGLPQARNTGLQMLLDGTVPTNSTHDSQTNPVIPELALLVDNDIYMQDDTIECMVKAYQNNDKPVIVCPRIRLIPERDTVQAEGAECHFLGTMTLRHAYTPVDQLPNMNAVEVGGCIGACYLVDLPRVMAAGAFDETFFFYFEDLEFSMRMRGMGYHVFCEPKAVVWHERGAGTPGLSFRGKEKKYPKRRMYLSMRHRLLNMFIHYRIWTLLVLLPALALYELASLGIAVLRGFGWQWVRAWWWNLTNVSLILSKRKRVQNNRKTPDRQVLSGGPIPLAPGFIKNPIARFGITLLNVLFNGYWKIARHIIA